MTHQEWRESMLIREIEYDEPKPEPQSASWFRSDRDNRETTVLRAIAIEEQLCRREAVARALSAEMRLRAMRRIAWALGGFTACLWAAVAVMLWGAR